LKSIRKEKNRNRTDGQVGRLQERKRARRTSTGLLALRVRGREWSVNVIGRENGPRSVHTGKSPAPLLKEGQRKR